MASVIDDPNGRRRIQFVGIDEKRKTLRLGKIDRKSAESICRHVEALLGAKIGGQPTPRDTAVWLAGVGGTLRDKLAAVGLAEPERRLTTGEFLATWLEGKRTGGYKPASLIAWGQTVKELTDLFGTKVLTDLTHADGEAYRAAMQGRSLRSTTVNIRSRSPRCRTRLHRTLVLQVVVVRACGDRVEPTRLHQRSDDRTESRQDCAQGTISTRGC